MRALTITLAIIATHAIALTTPAVIFLAAITLSIGSGIMALQDWRRVS